MLRSGVGIMVSGTKQFMDSSSSDNNKAKACDPWMDIDVKALDKSLQCILLHVRLQVPHHIGSHIDNKYGASSNYHNREKTLAELREESEMVYCNHLR